ncbi:MAG TPA: hypothetical protein VJL29_14780 [Thermoguttaceae bacterium]|nr:hypothetical protein [Thermoguttaceae bacterium]
MYGNMRAVAVALMVMVVGAGSVWAQIQPSDPAAQYPFSDTGPSRSAAPSPVSKQETAEDRIRWALEQKTTQNFTDAELGEVVAQLKRDHKIEIQLDKESLEELDLGTDTPVTCVVKDVSLRNALKLMLHPMELTFLIKDEVMLITTKAMAEEFLITKIYDVADLVSFRDEKGKPWNDYDSLIDTISGAVRPDSWSDMGGTGTINGNTFSTAKVLVISQTDEIHGEIAQLLAMIREIAARTPGDGKPPIKPRPKDSPSSGPRPSRQPIAEGYPGSAPAGGTSGGFGGMIGPSGASGAPGNAPSAPAGGPSGGMGGGMM